MDQIQTVTTYFDPGLLEQDGIALQSNFCPQTSLSGAEDRNEAMGMQKMPPEIKKEFVSYLPEVERARAIAVLRISPFLVANSLDSKKRETLLNDPLTRIGIKNEVKAVLRQSDFATKVTDSDAIWVSQRVAYLAAGSVEQKRLLDALSSYLNAGSCLQQSPESLRTYQCSSMLALGHLQLGLSKPGTFSEPDQGLVLRSMADHYRWMSTRLIKPADQLQYQRIASEVVEALIAKVICSANQGCAADLVMQISNRSTLDVRDALVRQVLDAKRKGQLAQSSMLSWYRLMAELCKAGVSADLQFGVVKVLARSICSMDEAQQQMILLKLLHQFFDRHGDRELDQIAESLVYAMECEAILRGNFAQVIQLLRMCLPRFGDQMAGRVLNVLPLVLGRAHSNHHFEALCLMQDISRTKNLSHAAIEEVVDLMSEVVSRKRLGASNQKLALEFISMHLPLVSRQISAAVTE